MLKFMLFLIVIWFAVRFASKAKRNKRSSIPVFYADITIEPPTTAGKQNEEARIHLKAMRNSIVKLLDEHKDLLDCLVYIGKADGKLSDKEVEVIAEICIDLVEYKKIPIYRWDTLFRDIKRQKIEEFEAAVSRVKMKGDVEMRLLKTGAERIIHTQKTLSPGEAYCIEFVNRIFTN